LQKLPNGLRDVKFRLRGSRPVGVPVAVVDIDDESLARIGRWPWRRDYLAVLIEEIFNRGAAGVALDIVFSEAQESVPEELRERLKQRKLEGLLRGLDFDEL